METMAPVTTETAITLTESAANAVKSMRDGQPEHAGKPLRVYVEGGGCSGMQYGMTFDEARAGDVQTQHFGLPVVMDELSAGYLRGATIDFSDSLNEGGFKITNPNARASCGCGKSFEA